MLDLTSAQICFGGWDPVVPLLPSHSRARNSGYGPVMLVGLGSADARSA